MVTGNLQRGWVSKPGRAHQWVTNWEPSDPENNTPIVALCTNIFIHWFKSDILIEKSLEYGRIY